MSAPAWNSANITRFCKHCQIVTDLLTWENPSLRHDAGFREIRHLMSTTTFARSVTKKHLVSPTNPSKCFAFPANQVIVMEYTANSLALAYKVHQTNWSAMQLFRSMGYYYFFSLFLRFGRWSNGPRHCAVYCGPTEQWLKEKKQHARTRTRLAPTVDTA